MIKCRICGDEYKDSDKCPGCGNSIIAPAVVVEKPKETIIKKVEKVFNKHKKGKK